MSLLLLKNDSAAKLLLRLTLGGLMLFHGISKLGSTATLLYIKGVLTLKGLPAELVYGVFIGELVAPILVILGFHTRIAAWAIVVNMLFAVWLVHMGDLFSLNSTTGGWRLELQAFYLLGALCIALQGSGRVALKPD